MANTKISALTAGAPAVATDLIPIDRSGTNYSLLVSDIGAEILASAALSGTPTAPTPTATTNNTDIATAAFVGSQIVDGTPAANSIAKVVSVTKITNESSPTGAYATIFQTSAAGVYRISGSLYVTHASSSAFVVELAGGAIETNSVQTQAASAVNLCEVTIGTTAAQNSTIGLSKIMNLGSGVNIQDGTFLASGSNTGGTWSYTVVIERLA